MGLATEALVIALVFITITKNLMLVTVHALVIPVITFMLTVREIAEVGLHGRKFYWTVVVVVGVDLVVLLEGRAGQQDDCDRKADDDFGHFLVSGSPGDLYC